MKNNHRLAITVICTSLLLGVFSSPGHAGRELLLSGQFNPEFAGKRIKKIVVAAPNVVQHFREQIEIRMRDELRRVSSDGVDALRFNEIVSPFKEFTGKQVVTRLKGQGVDSVVLVDVQMAGGRKSELAEQRKISDIPEDLTEALKFTANHRHKPNHRGKYRSTTVTVYDLASGGIIWRGAGQVNGNKYSVKWHKRSGRMLARKLGKALKHSGVLSGNTANKRNEPDTINYTSGAEVKEARKSQK